jgi:hypothetical protein
MRSHLGGSDLVVFGAAMFEAMFPGITFVAPPSAGKCAVADLNSLQLWRTEEPATPVPPPLARTPTHKRERDLRPWVVGSLLDVQQLTTFIIVADFPYGRCGAGVQGIVL